MKSKKKEREVSRKDVNKLSDVSLGEKEKDKVAEREKEPNKPRGRNKGFPKDDQIGDGKQGERATKDNRGKNTQRAPKAIDLQRDREREKDVSQGRWDGVQGKEVEKNGDRRRKSRQDEKMSREENARLKVPNISRSGAMEPPDRPGFPGSTNYAWMEASNKQHHLPHSTIASRSPPRKQQPIRIACPRSESPLSSASIYSSSSSSSYSSPHELTKAQSAAWPGREADRLPPPNGAVDPPSGPCRPLLTSSAAEGKVPAPDWPPPQRPGHEWRDQVAEGQWYGGGQRARQGSHSGHRERKHRIPSVDHSQKRAKLHQ